MEWHLTSIEQDSFGPCGICGETLHSDDELGEYVVDGKHVLAHAQCAITAGLTIA
jgi:hypothetical protein